MLTAHRRTIFDDIIDYICLLNNGDLFKIYSECGMPSILALHAQISPQYITMNTHIGVNSPPQISDTSCPAQTFFFLGKPCSLLVLLSPSASHLLALTNCTTFSICFAAITGHEMAASIHGTVESILFARANSMAHALPGAANSVEAG